MHDALAYAAYDRDTEVADEPIARPRTVTDGALTMQTYTMGKWHRRTPDLAHTACGRQIDTQRCPVRREELAGDVCPDCFTPFERHIAAQNNAKETP